MKQELKRIDPVRTANISALVYGLLTTLFALIFAPIFVLATLFAPEGPGVAGMMLPAVALVLYPVMGLVMGWISGLLSSAVYNLVIRWTGGLLFEFDAVTAPDAL